MEIDAVSHLIHRMMKKLILFSLLALSFQLRAETFYDQLCRLNPVWVKFQAQAPVGEARVFATDEAYIQAHLTAVEHILLQADISQLSLAQRTARAQHLALLHRYIEAANFPKNYYRPNREPVFIDEHGTHCAVGYLIQQSGHEDVARRIADENNYIRVYEIADKAVTAWQVASGFSLDELALIQPTYDFKNHTVARKPINEDEPTCGTVYFLPIVEYDANGKIVSEKKVPRTIGECKNGVLHGKWIQYACAYSNKIIVVEGNFVNGKKSGEWKHYTQYDCVQNPHPTTIDNWVNGELHGACTMYDINGKLVMSGMYARGKKTGIWKTWGNGILISEESFLDGEKHGDFKTFYNFKMYGGDSLHPLPISIDTYEKGVLMRKTYYSTNKKLAWDKVRVGDSLYRCTTYYDNRIWQQGYERMVSHSLVVYKRVSDDYGEPGFSATDTVKQEAFEKIGKWVMYTPVQHYLVPDYQSDSCHFYMEHDRIKQLTYFHNNKDLSSNKDSLVYIDPQPFGTNAYYGPRTTVETWSFSPTNGTMNCVVRDKENNVLYQATYNKENLLALWYYFPKSNQVHRFWTRQISEPAGSKDRYIYVRYARNGIAVENGMMLVDTVTRDGHWAYRDSTGKELQSGNYVGNVKQGVWQESTDSSKLAGNYVNGVRDGIWTERTATIKYQGKFVNGLREGVWQEYDLYHPETYWEGEYRQGKRVGKWKYINDKGRVTDRKSYD